MPFARYDVEGNIIRSLSLGIDCQKAIDDGIDEVRTEQNHKGSVDINAIVAKTGVDRIAETTKIQDMNFDENPYNNFQEMMEMVARGKSAFESLPAQVRDEFENSPAKYFDYCRNPENRDELIERGWMAPPEPAPQPVEVIITNPDQPLADPPPTIETPPE